jgi:dTDP-4-amino-4,6-dideoxygalactose transaminase
MGDYGCFSFFPSKNLGAAGDGGMIVTNDAVRADQLRILRSHGSKPKYHHGVIGGNFRLDEIQAAIVRVKLRYLDHWTAARQENADHYRRLFAASGLLEAGAIDLPTERANGRHIYNQYVIRAKHRDALQRHLQLRGIGTEVYYPLPMHLQPCFSYLEHDKGDFPVSEAAACETLALPIYSELRRHQIEYVVKCVAQYYF